MYTVYMAFKTFVVILHLFSHTSFPLCNIIPCFSHSKIFTGPGIQNLPYTQKVIATLVYLENSYSFFKIKVNNHLFSQYFLFFCFPESSLRRLEQLFYLLLPESCVFNIPVMLIISDILFFACLLLSPPNEWISLKAKFLPYSLLNTQHTTKCLPTNGMLNHQFVELINLLKFSPLKFLKYKKKI